MKRITRISTASSWIQNTQYQIEKQSKRQLLATRPLVSEGEAVALCCSQLPPQNPARYGQPLVLPADAYSKWNVTITDKRFIVVQGLWLAKGRFVNKKAKG